MEVFSRLITFSCMRNLQIDGGGFMDGIGEHKAPSEIHPKFRS